jgi:hypothetical protein
MRMSKERLALVDRIVDGRRAVLIIDNSEQRIVPAALLPAGTTEGSWLRVRFDIAGLASAAIDAEATEQARSRVEEMLDQPGARGREQ